MNCRTFPCEFSSGQFAGKSLPPDPDPGGTRVMLPGTASLAEMCRPAWRGAASAEMAARRKASAAVLRRGETKPAPLPSLGQIAPKMQVEAVR